MKDFVQIAMVGIILGSVGWGIGTWIHTGAGVASVGVTMLILHRWKG